MSIHSARAPRDTRVGAPHLSRSRAAERGQVALVILAVVAVAGLGVSLFLLAKIRSLEPVENTTIDVYGEVPPFRFTDQGENEFGRAEMLGKVNLVSFQFTRCPGVCLTMSKRLQTIYADFADRPDLQIVTITVDPDYDTPEVLADYAQKQGVVDDRWRFLHAPMADVAEICEKGFLQPADALPGGHSSRFALVDRKGRIRGFYDAMKDEEVDALRERLESMNLSAS